MIRPWWLLLFFLGSATPATGQINSRSPADTLRTYVRSSNDSLAIRAAYFLSYQHWSSNLDTAWHYGNLMMNRSRAANNLGGQMRAYHTRGVLFSQQGQADSAVANYLTALRLAEAPKRAGYRKHVYNSLAGTYVELEDYPAAAEAYRRALHAAGPTPGARFAASIQLNLGTLFTEWGRLDSAAVYLEPLRKRMRTDADLNYLAGSVAYNLGRLASARREYTAAARLFEESREASRAAGNDFSCANATLNLTDVLINQGQYVRARRELLAALPRSVELDAPLQRESAYKQLSRLDSLRGNYASALRYAHQYYRLRDSLSGLTQRERVAELEAQFDAERREAEIDRLAYRNEVAQRNARSRRRQIWLLAGLLALAIGLAGWALRSARRQRQLAREKDLLASEIDHRARNHLSILVGLLQLQMDDLDEDSARAAVAESQRRTQSISLLQSHLRRTGRGASIRMEDYLPELLRLLTSDQPAVTVTTEQLEVCHLAADSAVTVGLIISELTTNSLKYGRASPTEPLAIELATEPKAGTLVLTYKDSGPGYSEAAIDNSHKRGGLYIVRNLARQLGGELLLVRADGAVAHIDFPVATD